MTRKTERKSYDGIQYAPYRWKWGEPGYLPYAYLPKHKFEKKITFLLQSGGCTREKYDEWLALYKERALARRKGKARDARVVALWEPIILAIDREIASTTSSLNYYEGQILKRPDRDVDDHCAANYSYRMVLRDTRRKIVNHFLKADKTPKEAWLLIGREGPVEWEGFVPLPKQDMIREMFAALTRLGHGRQRMPFKKRFANPDYWKGATHPKHYDNIEQLAPPNPNWIPFSDDQKDAYDYKPPENEQDED